MVVSNVQYFKFIQLGYFKGIILNAQNMKYNNKKGGGYIIILRSAQWTIFQANQTKSAEIAKQETSKSESTSLKVTMTASGFNFFFCS